MTRISLLLALTLAGTAAVPTAASAKLKPSPEFAPAMPVAPPPPAADGSIFNVASGYAPLHTGNRARAVGDPLTIVLVESTTTSKSTSGKTDRNGGFSLTPPTAGPLDFLNPNALKASGQSAFKGQGNASQTSSISSQLGVTIYEIRPNGTALVRGEKRMMLSQGDEWVRFSGIVRLADIDEDSRIVSTRVADAHIVYSGKGSIQRAGREGWLQRFFNVISPF